MVEETKAQKLRVPGFNFKSEEKLAEAIEAFEIEFLGNTDKLGLSEEEKAYSDKIVHPCALIIEAQCSAVLW